MAGLTTAGFTARRADEWLVIIRDAIEARLVTYGLPSDIDWERDAFWGAVTAVLADMLADLSEGMQGLYDAFSVLAAVGVNLDALAILIGIARRAATYSQAIVTAGGTPGTVIAAGKKVRGGGGADDAIWTVAAPGGTIGGGGTVSLVVVADVVGATVAAIGTIDDCTVTAVSGWSSVTNPAAATVGLARESDAELRIRRAASLAVPGSRTMAGLRAALLEVDGVQNAIVVDNPTDAVLVVGGVSLAAHSFEAIVYPDTLTSDQNEAVGAAIYAANAAGIQTNGAESVTVNGLDGTVRTVYFAYTTDITIASAVDVTLEAGYVLGDVSDAIQTAFDEYVAAVAAIPGGGGVRISRLDLLVLWGQIEGIQQVNFATFTLTRTPPGGPAAADILLDLDEHAVAGVVTVT